MTTHTILQPAGWVKPKGYANGVAAQGRLVFVGGQIGWNGQSRLGNLEGIGKVYREVMGRNFPAMAVVEVTALVEDRAKVEIQAMAVVPT